MNSRRLFFVLIALLVLIIGGAGASLVLGNKFLDKQNNRLTSLKAEDRALDTVQASLVQAKKDIVTYGDLQKITASIVPQEKDQARTVREIVKIASDTGVSISSLTFPSSNLGIATKQAGGNAGTTASGVTQTQKVDGISGVERLEITVTSDSNRPVTYVSFLNFLSKLEQNRRTAQVSSITITPDSQNNNLVSFSLILNVYIKKAAS